jgi:hypothetical protein
LEEGALLGEDTDYRTRAQEKFVSRVSEGASSLHLQRAEVTTALPFEDPMAKLTFAVAALVALSVAGTRVQAQDEQQLASVDQTVMVPDAPAPATVDLTVPSGPSLQSSALSPRFSTNSALDANAMRRPSGGSGVGLMILGGAALITGVIIGDKAGTIIAVGGAIVGLYGLYVYLGRPSGMEHNNRIGLGYKLNTH